jgi:hypothetical protein
VIAAVAVGRVADHLIAYRESKSMSMSGIEIRLVEKRSNSRVVLDRVEVCDPQAVGDRAPCRRAATRTDPDAAFAGVTDEVPGDQEV